MDKQKSPLEDVPFSETDINLEISFAEQAANLKDSSVSRMCKGGGGDTLLPVGVSCLLLSFYVLTSGSVWVIFT